MSGRFCVLGRLRLLRISSRYPYTAFMRILNLFLITLLCVALPLQAIANAMVTETSCADECAAMMMDSAEVHDCCNDADTIAKTGKLCKAKQDCQPVNQGMINLMECRLSVPVGIEKTPSPSTI